MRLRLKPQFLQLVQSGNKRSTIRAGLRSPSLGPAEIVCGSRVVPIKIKDVETKAFGRLTQADAFADGFDSLDALKSTLLGFYPELTDTEPVTIIYFDLANDGMEHSRESSEDGNERRQQSYG